ncbi:MAG: acyltransferase [Capsulimonadaceae bacterium]|nr:acyltransferase [Capsulimonadaceae bacterium]
MLTPDASSECSPPTSAASDVPAPPERHPVIGHAYANGRNVTNDHWALLGGVRFFLASTVLCGHLGALLRPIDELPPILVWLNQFPGQTAVLCFFLVSGYSIAASIERQRHGYALRRLTRIYPCYAAAFLWACVPWFLFNAHVIIMPRGDQYDLWRTSQPAMVFNALALPSLIGPTLVTFLVSWSLTCEIVYYACAPALQKAPIWLVSVLIAASTFYYIHLTRRDWPDQNIVPILSLAWFWLVGWLLYKYRQQRGAALIACLFVVIFFADVTSKPSYILLVATVCALGATAHVVLPHLLSKVLSYLGEISYPLYLTHFATLIISNKLFGVQAHDFMGVFFITSVVIAAAFYHVVDVPCRRLARMSHA